MIPDGWIVFVDVDTDPRGRFTWYVGTNMSFLFVSRRTYKTEKGAKAAARKALNRFFSRFGEMPYCSAGLRQSSRNLYVTPARIDRPAPSAAPTAAGRRRRPRKLP